MIIPSSDRVESPISTTGVETQVDSITIGSSSWVVYSYNNILYLKEYGGRRFRRILTNILQFRVTIALNDNRTLNSTNFWLWVVDSSHQLYLYEVLPYSTGYSFVSPTPKLLIPEVSYVSPFVKVGSYTNVFTIMVSNIFRMTIYRNVKVDQGNFEDLLDWSATRDDEISTYVTTLGITNAYTDTASPPNVYEQFFYQSGFTKIKSYRSWITNLPKIYDPVQCESQYIPYLARLLGYDLKYDDLSSTTVMRRIQIQEVPKWYRLKGTNRSISYIFYALRLSLGVQPELAWVRVVDGSLTWIHDPRAVTVWVPIGVIGGWGDGSTADQNSEFAAYLPLGHKPSEYYPDSRVRINMEDIASDIPDVLNIISRIAQVLPYHLNFAFSEEIPVPEGDLFEFEYFPELLHNSSSTFHNQSYEWHSRAGGYENISVLEHDISITANEFGRYVLTV